MMVLEPGTVNVHVTTWILNVVKNGGVFTIFFQVSNDYTLSQFKISNTTTLLTT